MFKILIYLLFFSSLLVYSRDVVINEVMSSNDTTIYDEDGDAPDWIELYYSGSNSIDLSGFGLSDDSLDLDKWQFGNAIIFPGEHLLVFASNKDRKNSSYFHTNFKLSASGEEVILTDTSGVVLDRVYVPAAIEDISYARITDGAAAWVRQLPTPEKENSGVEFEGIADSISASLPNGFYSSAISVELSAGENRIFYTLDGSDPDSNAILYTGPIDISETTILKAVSLKENALAGPVLYHTYFINENTNLPVISLTSDPYNLFDWNYGIYVDGPGWTDPVPHLGANYWQDWEREAHIEFFDDNKKLGFSENCGIAIYGGWSRTFDQRSFSVKFRSAYGASKLKYSLFPDLNIDEYQSFILRNSGNDWQGVLFRDAFMQTLVQDLNIDYQEYRPAVVFINGTYWGIYNIREKISEHFVASHHNIDPDNIDMLENNHDVIHGDADAYNQFLTYLEDHDMQYQADYNYVNNHIETEELINYFVSEIYFNNTDWPGNNLKYWRSRDNGKWRWILYDTDFGFSMYESDGYKENTLAFALDIIQVDWPNPPWSTFLLRKLLQNPTFRSQFINRFADLLNTNFDSDRVKNIIHEINDHISSEIPGHLARWGQSLDYRNEHIDRLNTFADNRPANMRSFISRQFELNGTGTITLNASTGGKIKINTIYPDPSEYPWNGVYFKNNPVTVKAIAYNGYKFDKWSGTVTSDDVSLSLSVNNPVSLFASFSVDTSVAKDIVINEINYNSSDLFQCGDWIELYNRSDQMVDLSNWIFKDSNTNHKFIFPEDTYIASDQYIVLTEDTSAFTSCFPAVSNYIAEMDFGLSGSGESIKLLNEEGQIIDSLEYDDKSPWPVEADGSGATLELVNPDQDNARAKNWKASLGHGTPGRINSVSTSLHETQKELTPDRFLLFQNYPNPFNSITKIRFQLDRSYRVSIRIFDINGKMIRQLLNKNYKTGEYSYSLKLTENLSSGIYFYQLVLNDVIAVTKKMILIR